MAAKKRPTKASRGSVRKQASKAGSSSRSSKKNSSKAASSARSSKTKKVQAKRSKKKAATTKKGRVAKSTAKKKAASVKKRRVAKSAAKTKSAARKKATRVTKGRVAKSTAKKKAASVKKRRVAKSAAKTKSAARKKATRATKGRVAKSTAKKKAASAKKRRVAKSAAKTKSVTRKKATRATKGRVAKSTAKKKAASAKKSSAPGSKKAGAGSGRVAEDGVWSSSPDGVIEDEGGTHEDVQSHQPDPTESSPGEMAGTWLKGDKVRVLVVDDESEILGLLVPFLRSKGYAVSEAQDGDQALEKILTERPNIVVLDVMMPGLNGWEISRYVRARSELDSVRIIMATGIGKETNAATSPLYGADAYIDKPFQLKKVETTVADLVRRMESR